MSRKGYNKSFCFFFLRMNLNVSIKHVKVNYTTVLYTLGVSSDQENPLGKPYQTLGRLARRVSGYWEQIAYQLDLGDNFVETTKQNFPHLASDCCFHTLRKWFDKSPKEKRVLQSLENVFVELDIDREALNMVYTIIYTLLAADKEDFHKFKTDCIYLTWLKVFAFHVFNSP